MAAPSYGGSSPSSAVPNPQNTLDELGVDA